MNNEVEVSDPLLLAREKTGETARRAEFREWLVKEINSELEYGLDYNVMALEKAYRKFNEIFKEIE